MNQSVEMEIGGATIVVTSETIRARIIRDVLYKKMQICVDGVSTDMGIDNDDSLLVAVHNYIIFSSRIKVVKGKLPFELILPSDDDKAAIKKAVSFMDMPYDDVLENIANLLNRIDAPDNNDLAPGAVDEYKDLSSDELDELPEAEKKS